MKTQHPNITNEDSHHTPTPLPHGRPKTLTNKSSNRSLHHYYRTSLLISRRQHFYRYIWVNPHHFYYDTLMTRCYSRSHFFRNAYFTCCSRTQDRICPIYIIRNHVLLFLFLSLFPQRTIPNRRNRNDLTTYRNNPYPPLRSTTIKYRNIIILRSIFNLIPPCSPRQKSLRSLKGPNNNSTLRNLIYSSPSLRILRSPFRHQ